MHKGHMKEHQSKIFPWKQTVSSSEDTKDIIKSLNEAVSYAEEYVSSMQHAFIYNTALPLKNCEIDTEVIKKEEAELLKLIKKSFADDFDLKPYISVSVHIMMMWESIDKLSKLIEEKISEKILFSDKAVNETIFLLQRLIEILKPTADIILARNTFLKMYIQESQISVDKMATEYATLHEDRLIKGDCLPAASSLYINMLDAIKNIAWHSKDIAIKLAG
jgi:Na+/phosphate symporter